MSTGHPRVAVITGGSGGIGATIALTMSTDERARVKTNGSTFPAGIIV